MKDTLIVNLFGAPGAGKSTGAAYIYSLLKMGGVNAELVTEFAKDKTWEDNDVALKDQAYVFGEQSFRINRCHGKVDVIITDSPLPLSIIYNHDTRRLTENFNKMVMDAFNSYKNVNFLIERNKPYAHIGRAESEEESNNIASEVKNLLNERYIDYETFSGDYDGYEKIVKKITERLYKFGR